MEAKGRKRMSMIAFIRELGYAVDFDRHGHRTIYSVKNKKVEFKIRAYSNRGYFVAKIYDIRGSFERTHYSATIKSDYLSELVSTSIGYMHRDKLEDLLQFNARFVS